MNSDPENPSQLPSRRPVAFFDFDDTVVFADSMLHWQRWYARRRRLWLTAAWIWGAIVLRGLGRTSAWMKRAYMATANRETPESLQTLVRQFSREFLSQCGFPEILDRMWLHHALGHEIVVVTASPGFYLEQLQDMLPPHRLIATQLRFEGRRPWNLPRIEGFNTKGDGKLRALADAGYTLPAPSTFAYSDHISDLPLLESVEFALAVRPDEELEKEARQRGWPVLRPIDPFDGSRTRLFKALWFVFAPVGPHWPFLQIPLGKRRRRLWKAFRQALTRVWDEASRENHQGFGVACRELERLATRLKGAAPRLARALVQKPLVNLGHPAQPGLDRIWATGQTVGLSPDQLDALQRMAYQAPGCESARLVSAAIWSDGLYQVYRLERPSGSDRVLKMLIPGVVDALEIDLGTPVAAPPRGIDPVLHRAWDGLLSELQPVLRGDTDLDREAAVSARLRELFPLQAHGIWIPETDVVRDGGLSGLVMEAADGFALPSCLAYLRETRRLRGANQEPTPDYTAFAALIATAGGPLPSPRDLAHRLWILLSRAWYAHATWITLSGVESTRVIPGPDGNWTLAMGDFAGVAEFPDWCAHALREWDVVCPEGSGELEELCRAMGWNAAELERFRGRHRELVELIWHPLLRGRDGVGFAFEDWRLDGRLASLLGAGHQHEGWPIPDPCRRVFRTLWWLRRSLAGLGAEG